LTQGQLQQLAQSALGNKLRDAMLRHAPGFPELAVPQQEEFVDDALLEARLRGMRTEQGLAAYALALWFLEPGFPDASRYLRALLESTAPEVRKVHAMNEWVSARLGAPDNPSLADDRLRQAWFSTAAWGQRG
jgi:hypothetical protein